MDIQNSKIEIARTEHELLTEDPKSAKSRRRSEKRRRRRYKFSDKQHPKLGIVSSILAELGIVLDIIAIVFATMAKGDAGTSVGVLVGITAVTATIGIVMASITFKKDDSIFTFSWIGLIANIVVWLFAAFMIVVGI